ncbi:MAG: SDR family NAD(P)-dependent oxidoreductase [Pseudomonadota bacterium]
MRALVTGGNRGIGKEIARGLVAKGLDVVIGCRDPEAAEKAANEIGCLWDELNVTSDADCFDVVEDSGPFDVLVNNAGILTEKPLLLENPHDLEAHLGVMVRGPHYLTHATMRHMKAQGYGRVVNVSSGWGSFSEGLEGPGAYGIAKAVLNALTVASAREAPAGVKINAMCPGWVRTRMGGPSANLSPEEGADTGIWLATLPEDGPTGKFFRRRQEIQW